MAEVHLSYIVTPTALTEEERNRDCFIMSTVFSRLSEDISFIIRTTVNTNGKHISNYQVCGSPIFIEMLQNELRKLLVQADWALNGDKPINGE